MTNIVDLAEVRRAKAVSRRRHEDTRPTFSDPAACMQAIRSSLDTLAAACVAAGEHWPTAPEDWEIVARAGLRTRMKRMGGVA